MKNLRSFLFALVAPSLFAAVDPAQLAAARSLFDARKLPDAQSAYEKIADADPKSAEAQYYLAQLALRRNDTDEKAIAYAEKAVALAPDNAEYQHTLGEAFGNAAQKAGVLSKFGLAKKCLAAFQRAAALKPDNVEFHLSLFDYYRQAPGLVGGGADKAAAEAAIITKLDPARGQVTYITLLVADKKYDDALAHAAELKKIDAARGRAAYAAIYTETKQFDKALAEFDEALKASPDEYAANYQIGRFAANTGQFLDRGLAALRHCLELTPGKNDPGLAAAHWRIGNLLEKKHDPAGARAAYEDALKVDPKFSQASDALKKLK